MFAGSFTSDVTVDTPHGTVTSDVTVNGHSGTVSGSGIQ